MPFSTARIQTLRKDLGALLVQPCHKGAPGAAIVIEHNGRSLYAGARGLASMDRRCPLTEHSAIDGGSMAKTVTGLALALLEDKKRVDSSALVTSILPELPDWADGMRIHHLLHHESGLPSYFTLLYYMAGWHEHAPPSSDEVYSTICRMPGLRFQPGTAYDYSDSNYFLLARIVERTTGERFGNYARRRIFEPLKMYDTYCTDGAVPEGAEPAEGYVRYPVRLASPFAFRTAESAHRFHPSGLRYGHVGAEGLRTSAADLSKLGQQLLSPTLISSAQMTDRVLFAPRLRLDGFGYGYGLNVGTYHGHRFVGHNGAIQGHTGSLSVFPDHDLVVACLTNRSDMGAWDLRDTALQSLGLLPRKAATPAPPVRIDVQEMPVSGLFVSPQTAHFAQIRPTEKGTVVELDESPAQPATFCMDPALSEGSIALWLGENRVEMNAASDTPALQDWEGVYRSVELATSFFVERTELGVRLRNTNPDHPAMDLDYTPTLPDFFLAHDPHPGVSQIQFLRKDRRITGFAYRDYDGDGREAFVFRRCPGEET